MVNPKPYKQVREIDARLVTKTSLPYPKQALAALIMMWYASDKPGILKYGRTYDENEEQGLLDEETVKKLDGFFSRVSSDGKSPQFDELLADNPLFTSQIESLNAAFELIWHLASFSFQDDNPLSAERKGKTRYRKTVNFTTNIDLIDNMVGTDSNQLFEVLLAWIKGDSPYNTAMEKRLIKELSIFSEVSFYRTAKTGEGIVFTPSGLYEPLLKGATEVEISKQGSEVVGTTRILKSALKQGLNSFLTLTDNKQAVKRSVIEDILSPYLQRASATISLSNIGVKLQEQNTDINGTKPVDTPRNLILFGAPGTGKSHELARRVEKYGFSDVRRVTFYPDYTYSQFVGCFKPHMDYTTYESNNPGTSTRPQICYQYIPGPFLDVYVKALNNPDSNFLLIVEELNRANPAAVFGDLFQILDRKSDGTSEYDIAAPADMCDYLRLTLNSQVTMRASVKDDDSAGQLTKHISLPSNMYIWGTMNTADQGVFPIDTAFRRRWNFLHIGINSNESGIADIDVIIPSKSGDISFKWNILRKKINSLLQSVGVNEDKLLGPFFIPPEQLNSDNFLLAFTDKVLLYLYSDAGRTKRSQIFTRPNSTYSDLCDEFKTSGLSIFNGSEEWIQDYGSELANHPQDDSASSEE